MARQEIKAARAAAKLAALLQAVGKTEVEVKSHEEYMEAAKEHRSLRPSLNSRDADAVLNMLHKPASFTWRPCKRAECKQTFGTDYYGNGYCSDECRITDLKAMGIRWDPTKTDEERWGGFATPRQPPQTIPPAAVKALWLALQPIFAPHVVLSPEQLDAILPEPNNESSQDESTLPEASVAKTILPEQSPGLFAPLNFEGDSVFALE